MRCCPLTTAPENTASGEGRSRPSSWRSTSGIPALAPEENLREAVRGGVEGTGCASAGGGEAEGHGAVANWERGRGGVLGGGDGAEVNGGAVGCCVSAGAAAGAECGDAVGNYAGGCWGEVSDAGVEAGAAMARPGRRRRKRGFVVGVFLAEGGGERTGGGKRPELVDRVNQR